LAAERAVLVAAPAVFPALAAEQVVLVAAPAVFPALAAERAVLVAAPAVFPALAAEPGVMAAERAGVPDGPAPYGLAPAVPQAQQGGLADGSPADPERAGRAHLDGLAEPAGYGLAARGWAVRLGLRAG
jgi:hypothetical protein